MSSDRLFHLGKTDQRKQLYLTKEDLNTSVHIMGLSQSGKSSFIYYLCTQMIKMNKGFFLLDPHASIYWKLLQFQCAVKYPRQITLFDPSNTQRVVGFNPFLTSYDDPARVFTKAQQMADATLKVWGAEHTHHYVNIQKWLRPLYYVLLESNLTISSLGVFLHWNKERERNAIIEKIKYQPVRQALLDFYSRGRRQFEDDIKTAFNQTQFFTHPHVQRIMGLQHNNIDLASIIEKQQILLGNFQPAGDYLIGASELRVIGTLMINEIWETICRSKKKIEYYFIIDEFASYITHDIPHLLEESAKRGLHLVLIHQQPDQIKSISGAMQSAQTKITFRLENESSPKEERHFILRRANHETIKAKTPDIPDYHISDEKLESEVEHLTRNFLTIGEVDQLLYRPNDERAGHRDLPSDELTYEDLLR
jgi:TraM recognition site of TraD and TraG